MKLSRLQHSVEYKNSPSIKILGKVYQYSPIGLCLILEFFFILLTRITPISVCIITHFGNGKKGLKKHNMIKMIHILGKRESSNPFV